MTRLFLSTVVVALAVGCGNGTMPDAGDGMICPAGTHACGTACLPDESDVPANGCRLGCGDPCPVPIGGDAICSGGLCSVMCIPPAVQSGTTCVCTPQTCATRGVTCGPTDNGCGTTLMCGNCAMGSTCTDGQCVCADDDAEPNDADAMAFGLGDFQLMPDTMMRFGEYALSTMDDVDFYRVRVVDNVTSMNPTILVRLTSVAAGSDFELGIWYTCGSPPDAGTCQLGTADTSFGPVGCIGQMGMGADGAQLLAFCDGAGEEKGGTLIIRVRATTWMNACMPYSLEVSVS